VHGGRGHTGGDEACAHTGACWKPRPKPGRCRACWTGEQAGALTARSPKSGEGRGGGWLALFHRGASSEVVCPPRCARVGSTCGGSDGRARTTIRMHPWWVQSNEGGVLDLAQSRTSIKDDAQLSARTARRLRRGELCIVALGAGESAKRRIQSRARCSGRYGGCGRDENEGPRGRRVIRTRRVNATPVCGERFAARWRGCNG
jgi:hypothetical protein